LVFIFTNRNGNLLILRNCLLYFILSMFYRMTTQKIPMRIVGEKATMETIPFYKPKESIEVKDGYNGLVCISEVLRLSPTIKELIISNKPDHIIDEQARNEGMLSLVEDGIFKAVQGITTIEEVLRVVSE